MNKRTVCLLAAAVVVLFLGPVPGHAKTAKKKPEAPKAAEVSAPQQASTSWLALVDAGKYAESWDAASSTFQAQVTKEQWTQALTMARDPLGKFQSRTLQSGRHEKDLPGGPPGQYAILTYNGVFEKGNATETVILFQEKDGKWRVSGYFVKPA